MNFFIYIQALFFKIKKKIVLDKKKGHLRRKRKQMCEIHGKVGVKISY